MERRELGKGEEGKGGEGGREGKGEAWVDQPHREQGQKPLISSDLARCPLCLLPRLVEGEERDRDVNLGKEERNKEENSIEEEN
ncbi:hypothetical protein E2C01_095754 [Portunus trituberculatus]|uniref:Uncharacterized protein n=1 Tax=Portunus trituberculatus TaxID=210409 RepID=A0A5B7JW38_PORTR|nr:hypothetical protein [Portunus trituberculatus]